MRLKITVAILSFGLFNCGHSKKESNKNTLNTLHVKERCIENILKQDDSLGSVRNYACESMSLSNTINQYVNAIEKLNFEKCPEEFHKAFKSHTAAWSNMGEFTEAYSDLRGEMHDLFDQIEKSKDSTEFKLLLDAIWDTWKDVEDAKIQPEKP
ncbi:hypothetical protein [Winogradskyella sp. A3E31]|uniref:hypothetical protein n=1 Tax=Winogradskyella sp. A3E31 TaxID=3349637 RepID=UPI00398B5BD0